MKGEATGSLVTKLLMIKTATIVNNSAEGKKHTYWGWFKLGAVPETLKNRNLPFSDSHATCKEGNFMSKEWLEYSGEE